MSKAKLEYIWLDGYKPTQSLRSKTMVRDNFGGALEECPEFVQQAIADLENINAHLFSIEALMERIFDVRVPEQIEKKFQEHAGELAPDPLNVDRLRLNRLLHQTPDLPDRN